MGSRRSPKLFLFFVLLVCVSTANFASTERVATVADLATMHPSISTLSPEMKSLGVQKFLELTPKSYHKMTGERLGLKKTIALKVAQHKIKKAMAGDSEGIDKGVYIILTIFGLGWLALGLVSDWEGNDWWVNLILSILTCGIGGIIHALIKMKNYY